MKSQRESKGIVLSFFNLDARWWCVVNVAPRPLYPRERYPVTIVQEAGWAPGPIWTSAENLAPTVPDRPARGGSLHQLRNPAHSTKQYAANPRKP
jgi:hypothetical protein